MSRTYRSTKWCQSLARRKNRTKAFRDGTVVSYGCSNKSGRKNRYWRRIDRLHMDTKDRLLHAAMAVHYDAIEEFKRKSGFWNEGHELTTVQKRKQIVEMEHMLGVGFKCCIAGDGPDQSELQEIVISDHVTAGVRNGYKADVFYSDHRDVIYRRNRKEMVSLVRQVLFLLFPFYDLMQVPLQYLLASWYFRNRSIYNPINGEYLIPLLPRSLLKWKVQDFMLGQIGFKVSRSTWLYETPYETWNKLKMIHNGSLLDKEIRYETQSLYQIRAPLPPEIWNEIFEYIRLEHEQILLVIDRESRFLVEQDESSFRV